ncbi:MAG: DNA helicase RecQ [Saprospiraceae bacterium]|nr:DNA helicase RecQ [Saprospiraceae bacterium]
MVNTTIDLKSALKQNFGFDNFKSNQEQIIESVLNGKDTFVIMPTGGGKSLCYQLPAIILPGTAIIISPLIALMKNQVDSIRSYSGKDEIAHFLNSSLNKTQMNQVKADIMAGKTRMLFVAPETLTKDENIAFFKKVNVSFVAVDEAHCISEWGHDFRPEYRRIRLMIDAIDKNIPIVALTATATPKVQSDIVKNLNMDDVNKYVSSFNRDNLYYEIRPKVNKENTFMSIVKFIKTMSGKTGIIYVQARKTTEEIAKVLQVNGISAAPYHAGLDAKTRSKVQDDFLMEEIDVIVATIAFGMGIDKPDVRFVIHYDIPKSIENYYQETGRGGRDGLEGKCLAFYSYKDILKLEKFLRDKPVSERELSAQLMEEIIGYAETSTCRRQFLLHYFGEEFAVERCNKMCDNCRHPKETIEVTEEMKKAIKVIDALKERHTIKPLVEFTAGRATKQMKDYRFDRHEYFGIGKEHDELFWHSIFRQAILHDFIYKEIEEYGVLKVSEKGHAFLKSPFRVDIPLNKDFTEINSGDIVTTASSQGAALDDTLMGILKDLRKSEARKKNIQPWIVFSEPSLQDMATYYPTTMEDMLKISGVSQGKANRYGKPFIELIKEYVEENDIERPEDFVMKQVADKSKDKVTIIQAIDRKLPLDHITETLKMDMEKLLEELNMIVDSGTRLDINYYLDENMDEDVLEEVYDYFNEAESDSSIEAFKELEEEDITMEEIQLVRIKFITEMAN